MLRTGDGHDSASDLVLCDALAEAGTQPAAKGQWREEMRLAALNVGRLLFLLAASRLRAVIINVLETFLRCAVFYVATGGRTWRRACSDAWKETRPFRCWRLEQSRLNAQKHQVYQHTQHLLGRLGNKRGAALDAFNEHMASQ